MKMSEIRERGQALGMTGLARMRKGDLVRAIQRTEGNVDCFGAPWRLECGEVDCCWRRNCQSGNPG